MASVRVLQSPGTPRTSPSRPRSAKRRRVEGSQDSKLQAHEVSRGNTACKHEKTSTEDTVQVSSPARSKRSIPSQILSCGECGEEFTFANELVAHGRETQHRPFVCGRENCTKSYSKREHLTRHIETVHERGSAQQLEESKPFKCQLCQAKFAYKHGLTRHMKRSHKNLNVPFECPRCLLAFKKKSDLQAHSYVHTGVMPFECEDCGVRFLKKFLLTRHQRTHAARRESETQVLVCECQEICFSAEELQKHKQTAHAKDEKVDGKDEEIIDVCMNEGVQDDDVEMKESTDVKMEQAGSSSLLCRVCDRTFQRKQTLRMHLRTHFESLDERKEFVCPMPGCNKAYTRKSNLMTHYNAVHDERKSRRFACPREGCSARFGYKTTLTRHIDKVHDNPKPPKRRERSSAGILARALGVNQVGEDASRTNSSGGDEGATSASKVAQTQDPATIVQEVLETLCTTVAAANV